MDAFLLALSVFALLIWFSILVLPWRPWLHGEILEPSPASHGDGLDELTVLIPARDEADVIADTLRGVANQGRGIKVVLVDDGSGDGTAQIARQVEGIDLAVIAAEPLPPGWSGKLWALEQGSRHVHTRWTLLLDADIQLKPGLAAALLDKAKADDRRFVSVMACLRMESFWEKLLMPAFVYFFKLLYPFRLANSASPWFAAAAGGCILLETQLIAEIGGFAAIRDALIDDCALAKQVKQAGNRIWVGQSHAVSSSRQYNRLGPIWDMVARSAFTQLRYSGWLLGICTALMLALYVGPLAGLIWGGGNARACALAACACLFGTYLPTLHYYRRSAAWAWCLPAIAALYLAMTWTSALRYWRGDRSRWKGRVYSSQAGRPPR